MNFLQKNLSIFAGIGFVISLIYSLFFEMWYPFLLPLVFALIFFMIYKMEYVYYFIFLAVPLSFNIEEYTNSFGLFVPTEPILAMFLVLCIAYEIRKPFFPNYIWKDYLTISILLYLSWIFITALTSTNVLVSMKFLIVRLWFIVPMYFLGVKFFKDVSKIKIAIWLFSIGMTITIIYTVYVHSTYSFGEKESHWVMWPFFKDHTVYGAIVALILPLNFGLYFYKKHSPLTQAIIFLIILINLVGLYFSYTRAAWLSVVAAIGVLLLIKFKIKFKYILFLVSIVALTLVASWDSIQQSLEKNKHEHTTEDFGKRIQSAANISTDASNLERINRWTSAWRMYLDKPIMGHGPGTYAFEYAKYQDPNNLTIISTNFGDGGNAHSEYLGPLSEMGTLGLLFTLLVIGCMFYKGITLYIVIPIQFQELKVFTLVMVLSLVTYFVHGFLNNYLDTDKAAVPIWFFCACFVAIENYIKDKSLSL